MPWRMYALSVSEHSLQLSQPCPIQLEIKRQNCSYINKERRSLYSNTIESFIARIDKNKDKSYNRNQ